MPCSPAPAATCPPTNSWTLHLLLHSSEVFSALNAPRDPSYRSLLGVCRAEASVCDTHSAALSGWSLRMRVRQRLWSLGSLQPSREHGPDGAQRLDFVCVQKGLLSCKTLTHVWKANSWVQR